MDFETAFRPNLHILPLPQQRLWGELRTVPEEFTLYGGTAVALHLAHRQSIDFDFFGKRPFDPVTIKDRLSAAARAVDLDALPSIDALEVGSRDGGLER